MALTLHLHAEDIVTGATWPDRSGNARDATQGNAGSRPTVSATITPLGGPAVLFDGTDDWMGTAAFASPTAGVTVISLVRPTHSTNTWRTLMNHAAAAGWTPPYSRVLVRTRAEANLGWEGCVNDASGATSAAQEGAGFGDATGEGANTWFILELVYDQTNVKLYRDGVETATKAFTGALTSSTQPLMIGSRTGPGDYYMGYIAELRVYDTALDSTARTTARAEITADHISAPAAPSGGVLRLGKRKGMLGGLTVGRR